MMPRVKITDLLAEVDSWTGFVDQFVHLRTNVSPKHRQALLASVLADGINLGLTRMAEACRDATLRQLTWTADWHIRDECYSQALAQLIDFQNRQPLAAHWGDGMTSSSDGQYFRAGGQGQAAARVNLHYGVDSEFGKNRTFMKNKSNNYILLSEHLPFTIGLKIILQVTV